MPIVIDASVTMAWHFEDEATERTDTALNRLRSDSAIVPPLWPLEISNVLLVAERRNRTTEAQSARFLDLLGQLPIHVDSLPTDPSAIVSVGRRHGLSAYDATYLALAQRLDLPLATLDDKLLAACRAAGVRLAME
ncbi:MAG TPA: type II toxin-antitoxin system VapC family toxin [Ilumatobacteraceae bacterium]|jgi:predicted nucleic acid-binding protein